MFGRHVPLRRWFYAKGPGVLLRNNAGILFAKRKPFLRTAPMLHVIATMKEGLFFEVKAAVEGQRVVKTT